MPLESMPELKWEEMHEDFKTWIRQIKLQSGGVLDVDKAKVLASQLIDCGYRDVECIIEMEDNFSGTIDRAMELKEELGLNFATFVIAVKQKAIEQVESELTEREVKALNDMVIDDNYVAWGGVAHYANGMTHEAQDAFARWVRSGNPELEADFLEQVTEDRLVGR